VTAIYIYIYIYTDRERVREFFLFSFLVMSVSLQTQFSTVVSIILIKISDSSLLRKFLSLTVLLCAIVSILGETSLRLSSFEERRIEAASLHAEAIHLANLGSYTASLPLFRAAVRMDQDHPLYLNDLGVTEMRMGDLQRAKRRFLHALAVDPNNKIAKDNLSELRSFMREEDFTIGLSDSYPQKHNIDSPLTVQPSELFALFTVPSSLTLDQLLAKPFVCRGALQEWGWRFLTSDYAKNKLDLPQEILSLLVQTFGGERVNIQITIINCDSSHVICTILCACV
jgi:tetratricopeptide (TPR) repeat protein